MNCGFGVKGLSTHTLTHSQMLNRTSMRFTIYSMSRIFFTSWRENPTLIRESKLLVVGVLLLRACRPGIRYLTVFVTQH